jgi:hypothetical protein
MAEDSSNPNKSPSVSFSSLDKDGDEDSEVEESGVEKTGETKPVPTSDPNQDGDEDSEVEESGVEKTGENKPVPTSDPNHVDSESGISDFSETDTEDDADENLPLSPSDTDEDSADEDRRAYAERHTRNPELKGGEYRPLMNSTRSLTFYKTT